MEARVETGLDMGKPPTPIVRDADALLRRGIEALEREHHEEAVVLLRQAVNLAPESADGFLALGIALMRTLQMQAAMAALETAIVLAPDAFYPRLRMAELYMRVGVPTRAREELNRAMDLSQSAEQRQMVRALNAVEAARAPKRAWRPDFSRLLKRGPRR
ncbi:MAG TPA: tetratricopeptide repeat protein [Candidatus Binataceae bacterium]